MIPDLKKFPLLPRKKRTSKADYGHALILAGSAGMPGAAILSAEACLKSGAGLVTLATPKSVSSHHLRKITPEIILLPLPESRRGTVSSSALAPLRRYIKKRRINVLAVGPGLGRDKATAVLIRKLVSSSTVPIVLDADGLNAFEAAAPIMASKRADLVLTPHTKEFERVFSRSCPAQLGQRATLAKKLAHLYDVTIVLKGHRTLVADRTRLYRNRTGNPGMAKGGSGDVLTGMMSAFIAQGLPVFEAASWAVFFHGLAGDRAVKETGELGLLASDIIRFLPKVFGARK